MIKQDLKDLYFIANQWLVIPNTAWTKWRFSKRKGLLLHLGCGDDYLQGMINVDGNFQRKKELWLDLRNDLPFADGSAALVFCSHTLEHLYPYEAIKVLKEIRRVLASDDGVARIAVPSFEKCLEIVAGKRESGWPRAFEDAESQALNYLFCDGQHKYGYCAATLKAFAEEAGFSRIENYSATHKCAEKSYHGVVLGNEPQGSLIFELYP